MFRNVSALVLSLTIFEIQADLRLLFGGEEDTFALGGSVAYRAFLAIGGHFVVDDCDRAIVLLEPRRFPF